MGGIVDDVISGVDALTLGVTGIGSIAGSDPTGTGGMIKDATNSIFGEGVEAKDGINPFQQETSVGTTALNPATGEIVSNLSPEMQTLFDQGIGQSGMFAGNVPGAGDQASSLSQGFLSAASEFDPYAFAEDQFNRLDAILEPGRKDARTGTAAGLLATGRLGGTAGNRAQADVEGEIERQRQGLLSEQFTSGQNILDSLVNRGVSTGAYGQQQQLTQQQLSQGALMQALGLDSQLQSQLALGGQLTRHTPIQGEESGFDSILRGAATTGLGTLIGNI